MRNSKNATPSHNKLWRALSACIVIAMVLALLPTIGTEIARADGPTEDLVINPELFIAESGEEGKGYLSVSKTAVLTAENEYDVTLAVEVEKSVDLTSIKVPKDLNVVLILDISRSFENVPGSAAQVISEGQKFLAGLQGTSATRNIAVVYFAGNATTDGWKTVEAATVTTQTLDTGTNYQAAFTVANALIETVPGGQTEENLSNTFVVFITDGEPTVNSEFFNDGRTPADISDKGNYSLTPNGAGWYMNGVGKDFEDNYKKISNKDYQLGIDAARLVTSKGIKIHSIYIETENGTTFPDNAIANGITNAEEYLTAAAGIGSASFSRGTIAQLSDFFEIIAKTITFDPTVWQVIDEMGENVTASYVTGYDESIYTIENNTLVWNLYNDIPSVGDTTKTYTLTYHAILDNQADDFDFDLSAHDLNDSAILTYFIFKEGGGDANRIKEAEFPVPAVKAPPAALTFTKTDGVNPLYGAEFALTDTVTGKTYTASSGTNGIVSFPTIPSGHTYILSETTAPENFEILTDTWAVSVNLGVVAVAKDTVLVDLDDFEIVNTRLQGTTITLGAKKEVTGSSIPASWSFNIGLFASNATGAALGTALQTKAVTNSAAEASFTAIPVDTAGTYYYLIKETSTDGDGWTIDGKQYLIRAVVTDVEGELQVALAYKLLTGEQFAPYAAANIVFTNNYTPTIITMPTPTPTLAPSPTLTPDVSETPAPSDEITPTPPQETSTPTSEVIVTPVPEVRVNEPTPPAPTVFGDTLVPLDDGGFMVLDEDGTPLGEWHWDAGEWVFTEYPTPLGEVPHTGDAGVVMWLALAIVSGAAVISVLAKKKRAK
jgi:hypothetical protein